MKFTILAILAGALRTFGIQITAPIKCGGSRTISHAMAKFGRRLAQNSTPAPVHVARSTDNAVNLGMLCTPMNDKNMRDKIVVGLRGKCEFSRKAMIAQNAGAIGLIVINNENEDVLVTMKMSSSGNTTTVIPEIPSIMILFSDWKSIENCSNDILIRFDHFGEYVNGVTNVALNWAMIRGLVLWVLCQCGITIVRYKRRFIAKRQRNVKVRNLPWQVWNCDGNDDDVICVVCIEQLQSGDMVRVLNCGHIYHVNCIDSWLMKMSNRCPVCMRCVLGDGADS